MAETDGVNIDLRPLSREEAARISGRRPGPGDRWAAGFPGPDDDIVELTVDYPAPFGFYALVPRSHGLVIGTAGFFGPPDAVGEVVIGYGLVEGEWGRGYGTRVVARLVEIARAHGGVSAIIADTGPENIASQRVLEKNGFERVEVIVDHYLYLLRLTG